MLDPDASPGQAALSLWNCPSSVEPFSAVVEDWPCCCLLYHSSSVYETVRLPQQVLAFLAQVTCGAV